MSSGNKIVDQVYNKETVISVVEADKMQKCNHTHHIYIDICDDLMAGTLLDRILYWFTPNNKGQLKVRVFKDGYYWLAKGREDWHEEIRISAKQYDRAIKILQDKGFVEIAKYKFNGAPMIHIRPILEKIQMAEIVWKNKRAAEIVEAYNTKKIDNIGFDPNLGAESADNNWFFPKGQNPFYPMGEIQITQTVKSLTKNTTENTTKNNNNIRSKKVFEQETFEKEFEEVWKEYPNKKGKPKAKASYIKARKSGETKENILSGLKKYKQEIEHRKIETQFIKNGDTWFRNECWNDEYETRPAAKTNTNSGVISSFDFEEDLKAKVNRW